MALLPPKIMRLYKIIGIDFCRGYIFILSI